MIERIGAGARRAVGREQEQILRIENPVVIHVVVERNENVRYSGLGTLLFAVAEKAAAGTVVSPNHAADGVAALQNRQGVVRLKRHSVAKTQAGRIRHIGNRLVVRRINRDGERHLASLAGEKRLAQPPLQIGHVGGVCRLGRAPRSAGIGRIIHDISHHARRQNIVVGRRSRHISRASRNGILHHQRHEEIRQAHGNLARVGEGDGIVNGSTRCQRSRIRRFLNLHLGLTAGKPFAQSVPEVAVELLVVFGRSHRLIRRQSTAATAAQAEELIAHIAHRPVVVFRQTAEVELVFGVNHQFGAVVQLHPNP